MGTTIQLSKKNPNKGVEGVLNGYKFSLFLGDFHKTFSLYNTSNGGDVTVVVPKGTKVVVMQR